MCIFVFLEVYSYLIAGIAFPGRRAQERCRGSRGVADEISGGGMKFQPTRGLYRVLLGTRGTEPSVDMELGGGYFHSRPD